MMLAELKQQLKLRARDRGISLGALMREIVADQIAIDEFNEWLEIYQQLRTARP